MLSDFMHQFCRPHVRWATAIEMGRSRRTQTAIAPDSGREKKSVPPNSDCDCVRPGWERRHETAIVQDSGWATQSSEWVTAEGSGDATKDELRPVGVPVVPARPPAVWCVVDG